jgi:hypothetical protein
MGRRTVVLRDPGTPSNLAWSTRQPPVSAGGWTRIVHATRPGRMGQFGPNTPVSCRFEGAQRRWLVVSQTHILASTCSQGEFRWTQR